MKFKVQELVGTPAVIAAGNALEFDYLYEARAFAKTCTDAGNSFHISAWAGPVAIEAYAVMSAIDARVAQVLLDFDEGEREEQREYVERLVIDGMS